MALKITADCTNCFACETVCPNDAISQADIFTIDPSKCTECVGFFNTPQCVDVCNVACIIDDASHVESESELLAKAQKLHPKEKFPTPPPSRFRK